MSNKYFFSVLFCLLILGNIHSQNSFLLGLNGGVNLSKYKFTGDFTNYWTVSKSKFGLNGGVSAGVEFNRFAILTGVSFIQKGGRFETDNRNVDINNDGQEDGLGYVKASERLNVISIPLFLRYRFLSDDFGVSISAGPTFNIGISGTTETTTELTTGQTSRSTYTTKFGSGITDDYKVLQMGFVISPGVHLAVGEKGRLNFNFIWDLGASSIANQRLLQALNINGKVFSRAVLFSIGYEYKFEFGDKY